MLAALRKNSLRSDRSSLEKRLYYVYAETFVSFPSIGFVNGQLIRHLNRYHYPYCITATTISTSTTDAEANIRIVIQLGDASSRITLLSHFLNTLKLELLNLVINHIAIGFQRFLPLFSVFF